MPFSRMSVGLVVNPARTGLRVNSRILSKSAPSANTLTLIFSRSVTANPLAYYELFDPFRRLDQDAGNHSGSLGAAFLVTPPSKSNRGRRSDLGYVEGLSGTLEVRWTLERQVPSRRSRRTGIFVGGNGVASDRPLVDLVGAVGKSAPAGLLQHAGQRGVRRVAQRSVDLDRPVDNPPQGVSHVVLGH